MHCGSVSRAAERLFLAPPLGGAVSRRLTERAYTAVCKNFVAAGNNPSVTLCVPAPLSGEPLGDTALQKPPLKGEGGPLAVERFPG